MESEKKIRLHSTLDRPYTIISGKDPICDAISEQGRMIEAYELPKDPDDIDEKLDFDGNVVHVYDDGTIYLFESPHDLQLVPRFQVGELVSVVGHLGTVRWKTIVALIDDDTLTLTTSCGRNWTMDGKIVSPLGAHSDLQICRYF